MAASGVRFGYADGMPDQNQFEVKVCPAALRTAALRMLHDRLPADQQSGLVQTLQMTGVQTDFYWDGLLVACTRTAAEQSSEDLRGVVWTQLLPGHTACVWIPPQQGAAGLALLKASSAAIDRLELPLAQLVVSPEDGYSSEEFQAAGFPLFAQLVYMYVDLAVGGETGPPAARAELNFVSHAEGDLARLGQVIEQTYQGTLDCPGLDGMRSMSQILEGYRSQGRHCPDQWYRVEHEGQDVGALILTEHPDLGNWELIYMGLTPAARGRSWGEEVVRFAISAAARHGAERLVCAVDVANWPAVEMYRRVGFIDWAERIVYARLRAPT